MTKTVTTANRRPDRSATGPTGSPRLTGTGPDGNQRPPKGLMMLVVGLGLAIVALVLYAVVNRDRGLPSGDSAPLAPIPAKYDAERAFQVLVDLCGIGPRPSGSPGMRQQQDYLVPIFKDRGATVSMQTFEIRHPEDGSTVPMANLIASFHPDRPKRFLICAHYDTRPYPDQDRRNKQGIFIGANDGASGTAALVELAHHMDDLPQDVGVDMVLFDGEEFIWQQGRDDYFLGSKFFAEKYVSKPPAAPYRAGILLDMVADRELKLYYERNSMRYARELTVDVWKTAKRLGVREFVPRIRHELQDDHLPLNQTARIPTVDLIDFDYPRPGLGAPQYWHTEQDVPKHCSGRSLAAVVWVVHEWLKQQ